MVRRVTASRPQARQVTPDGTVVYRWYVYLKGRSKPSITWAATAEEARQKRPDVRRVEPAPALLFTE